MLRAAAVVDSELGPFVLIEDDFATDAVFADVVGFADDDFNVDFSRAEIAPLLERSGVDDVTSNAVLLATGRASDSRFSIERRLRVIMLLLMYA